MNKDILTHKPQAIENLIPNSFPWILYLADIAEAIERKVDRK